MNQIGRMHARSFVTSLEMTLKVLAQLKELAQGHEFVDVIQREEARVSAEVPHLKALRDSIAHEDERIRGRGRVKGWKSVEIAPDPLDIPGIVGGSTPPIVVGTLTGDVFRYTAGDGTQAEISISDATLESLIRCVQAVVDGAPWYRCPGLGDPPPRDQLIPLNAAK